MKLILTLSCAAAALTASAQITQIPTFTGTLNEGFETFTTLRYAHTPDPYAIMGGAASIAAPYNYVADGTVFSLASKPGYSTPTTGTYLLGTNDPTGSYTITFANPVDQFGGYFNCALGTGFFENTVSYDLFGAGGSQIGGTQVVTMSTNSTSGFVGFASTVPIKSVTVSGYFVVADDLRANVSPVPEPATIAALGLGAVAMLRRRKRA